MVEYARKEAPIHSVLDAVADRALAGPTELTTDDLATLFRTPPDPERLFEAQRMLEKVGITWPGSPEIPEPPPYKRSDPHYDTTTTRLVGDSRYGNIVFDRNTVTGKSSRASASGCSVIKSAAPSSTTGHL